MNEDASGSLHDSSGRLHHKGLTAPQLRLDEASPRWDPSVVRSRRALINVLSALADQRDALTVLGAHAVMEVTQCVSGVPEGDSTRDADVGVHPEMLSERPRLSETLTSLGYEAIHPDRPGVWSPIAQRDLDTHARDTVDLIAPFEVSYAEGEKKPRRGAHVGEHGDRAVSATRGTELTVVDRSLMMIRSFDGGDGIEGYVAGPSALLCAKAYKINDRLNAASRGGRRGRLRSKDFADVYRLTRAISPDAAADAFSRGEATSRIGNAVAVGRDHLIELLTDAEGFGEFVADAWSEPSLAMGITSDVQDWCSRFAG